MKCEVCNNQFIPHDNNDDNPVCPECYDYYAEQPERTKEDDDLVEQQEMVDLEDDYYDNCDYFDNFIHGPNGDDDY